MLAKTLRANFSSMEERETAVKVINRDVVPVFRKLDGFGDATLLNLGDTGFVAIFTYDDDAMDAAENDDSILSDALSKGLFSYGVNASEENIHMLENTYRAL